MIKETLHNDRLLFRQIAEGNENAFRIIFDQYRSKLASFAISMTTSELLAEDIVQDVFAGIWQNRSKLPEIENPGGYLFMMLRNRTIDQLRKVAASKELVKQLWAQSHQPAESPDLQLYARESQQLIAEALSQLSQQKQQVFYLSRVQGLTHDEIAQQLDLSKSRVKNIVVEVLKYTRDYLARHSPAMVIVWHWLFNNN